MKNVVLAFITAAFATVALAQGTPRRRLRLHKRLRRSEAAPATKPAPAAKAAPAAQSTIGCSGQDRLKEEPRRRRRRSPRERRRRRRPRPSRKPAPSNSIFLSNSETEKELQMNKLLIALIAGAFASVAAAQTAAPATAPLPPRRRRKRTRKRRRPSKRRPRRKSTRPVTRPPPRNRRRTPPRRRRLPSPTRLRSRPTPRRAAVYPQAGPRDRRGSQEEHGHLEGSAEGEGQPRHAGRGKGDAESGHAVTGRIEPVSGRARRSRLAFLFFCQTLHAGAASCRHRTLMNESAPVPSRRHRRHGGRARRPVPARRRGNACRAQAQSAGRACRSPRKSLPLAAARETLEETGWHVTPTALVGIYRWESTGHRARRSSAFPLRAMREDARHRRVLSMPESCDALWLSYEEIVARRADHRSPLVLRCIDDYRAGKRWPLHS